MDEISQKPAVASKGISAFSWLIELIGMLTLVTMTVIVNFSVVTRYFLSYTPGWGESGSLLCMVWFGFLSMALGVRDNQHISITIMDHLVSPKALKKLDYFKEIAIFLFGLFMIYQGLVLCEIGMLNNMPGLDIPSTVQYAAVPVGGLALCVYSMQQFIRDIRNKGEML